MLHKSCERFLALQKQVGPQTAIVCVSKYAPLAAMQALASLNTPIIFGENKWQVAQEKLPYFKDHPQIEWHFIGHLQSNKANKVVAHFDVIQSVDSLKLAEKINQAAENLGKTQRIFLQINFSEEAQKYGGNVQEKDSLLKALLLLKHIKVEGVMCMAAIEENPDNTRSTFKQAKQWFDKIKQKHPNIQQLSMGMSQDYKQAILEGSTMIRLGSYFFQ